MRKINPDDYQLLKRREVERLTGLGRSSIYAMPGFPRPVKLGPRGSAWLASEVCDWIRQRVAERDEKKDNN